MNSYLRTRRAPDDSNKSKLVQVTAPAPEIGRTLLPSPLAHAVSLATRSTCFAIRAGSVVSSYGFDFAKIASLSSLELGRTLVETILTQTGSNVVSRSKSELSREEAESILESSLSTLHTAMTKAVFWTTATFELTGSTISIASGVSQLLLSSLDQFFGSTDSSRAIASIITLIRREFQNPATGMEGERVGVMDLVLGLCALAMLQHSCRKYIESEHRRLGSEETVWDVVVLTDGRRVDIQDDGELARTSSDVSMDTSSQVDPAIMQSIEEHGNIRESETEEDDDDDLPEMRLRSQIMRSLPAHTSVSISTSVATTKTITVDISGPEIPRLSPPPGVEIIEERQMLLPAQSGGNSGRAQANHHDSVPGYRVVYRVNRNKLRSTALRRCDETQAPDSAPIEMGEAEEISDSSDSPTPPASPPPSSARTHKTSPPRLRSSSPHPGPKASRFQLNMTSKAQQPRKPQDQPPSRAGLKRQATKPLPPRPSTSGTPATNEANQKRLRIPLSNPDTKTNASTTGRSRPAGAGKQYQIRTKNSTGSPNPPAKTGEKRPGLRQAFSGYSLSGLWHKGPSAGHGQAKEKSVSQPATANVTSVSSRTNLPYSSGRTGSRGKESRLAVDIDYPPTLKRTPSGSSYISVHKRSRDSIVSQTDTYSIHSEYFPTSPHLMRTEAEASGPATTPGKEKNEEDAVLSPPTPRQRLSARASTHSLCSIATNDSQTSLVLSSFYQQSAYANSQALNSLRRTGMVEGTFPRFHILRNITRYVRFSTASYGSSFMKYLGISKDMPILKVLDGSNGRAVHHDVWSFMHHTASKADNILLASFVDPQGGSDSSGKTETNVPMVHYISLDHESKAVVLACRGTLGFEDVLADMTCDYDELSWKGKSYKVHKGIHASARRLLYGGDGKVLVTLKEALDEFSDYGLVLCGHSLGGAVTALLGIMLSEPNTYGTNFVTSAEPHSQYLASGGGKKPRGANNTHVCLPPGRPIHVYAYGPPGTMSSSLRKATRGLITTVVQGNDLVPYLSLGVLHDLQAVALAFKSDEGSAKAEIRRRFWRTFQASFADRWYSQAAPAFGRSANDDEWALAAYKTLRATMVHEKLLPPGEVFVVESTRVLRRDAFVRRDEDHIGRPARRAVLKYVRDVEARFRGAKFGTSMLADHSPAAYEDALNTLRMGVSEPDFGW